MAYYSFFPTKDSTLYELHKKRNTGIDQIVELLKLVPGTPDEDGFYYDSITNSRILMQFDINNIAALIAKGTIPTRAQFYLNIRATEATDNPVNYNLNIFAVSQSWDNGRGHYYDYPEVTEGVSWQFKDGYYNNTGEEWLGGALTSGTTGSYASTEGGGTWYTGSLYSAVGIYNYEVNPDIKVNVTSIVKEWLSGSIDNNGFIIKRTSVDEVSTTHMGSIKYFGKDSHTIFIPRLEAFWDDSVTDIGSLLEVGDQYNVFIKNIKDSYKESSKEKFRIVARDKYPVRTFSTSSNYRTIKRLPTSSYYAIIDEVTDTYIIPFDTGSTKISTDSNGNFFRLDMQSLLPERFYRIILKVQREGGLQERIIDDEFYFKVLR